MADGAKFETPDEYFGDDGLDAYFGAEPIDGHWPRTRLLVEPERKIVRPYCIGFRRKPIDGGLVSWVAAPAFPFRIKGLLAWGTTAASKMHKFQVRNEVHIMCSADPVPLRFFRMGLSFDEFVALLEAPLDLNNEIQAGFQGWMKEALPGVSARLIFDVPTLELAYQLHIETSGPLSDLIVWGNALEPVY